MTAALAILLIVAVIALALRRSTRRSSRDAAPRDSVEALTRRYLRRLHMAPAEARATLERQLAQLAERFPGTDRRWQLEKLLIDLERDR